MAEIPIRCFAVSAVVLRSVGGRTEFLLLRRTGTLFGEWCQIAGAIENDETAWEAALREVKEETGLECRDLYSADICEQFYDADRNAISLLPVFVAFVNAGDFVVLNHEHSEFQWVSFDEALAMVTFSGQRAVLRHIQAEFVDRMPTSHLLIAHADQPH